jgi:predicted alpha-1,6-mannanase (GH76 family)
MHRSFLFAIALLFTAVFVRAQSGPSASLTANPNEQRHRAQLGVNALERWYVKRTGLYRSTGWWNAANATTVLIDYSRISGSKHYLPVIANTFKHAQVVVPKTEQVEDLKDMTGAPGFLNTYYDDEGWWALAWIDAYDLTGDARYLAMGRSIFADMAGGWDETCGGGIWWSKNRTYKNAIANELFFSVAAHLATRLTAGAQHDEFAEWARREWQWFRASGMINADGLVNDGLTINKATGACRNNGRTIWTYNQGVLVGALAEWSKTAPAGELPLTDAARFGNAALTHLTDAAGILHDSCEPKCGGDGVQFKGIFVRNLSALEAAASDERWERFFQANAESIWTHDRGPKEQLGVTWSGPFAESNAGSQSSALDALVAAAVAEKPFASH